VDTRDTPEQAELRRAARRLALDLGPSTVAGLDDGARAARLAAAVAGAGWLELRDDAGDGTPVAGGVETAIVAEALGEFVTDVAFAGPVLARDLARRAGVADAGEVAVAFVPDLTGVATVAGDATDTTLYAVDAGDAPSAFVVVPDGSGYRLALVPVERGRGAGADLTRGLAAIPPGAPVRPVAGPGGRLDAGDLARWAALGLALTSADLVGVMRGVLGVTVAYAAERRQFGVPVGSFQAVQHLLAESRCLLEGSISVSMHAAWAVDDHADGEPPAAGRVAKAYCARAARTVCETAIQVHGGIGNTWDCIVHVYLRRALLSSQWFGDDARQLGELQRERLGAPVGLP
jgi:hypothetical protein